MLNEFSTQQIVLLKFWYAASVINPSTLQANIIWKGFLAALKTGLDNASGYYYRYIFIKVILSRDNSAFNSFVETSLILA